MKRIVRVGLLTWMLLLGVLALSVSAWAAPVIEDIDYEGKGKVEVEFVGKVQYKDLKLTVKDSKGKKAAAALMKKDNDDVTFQITGYQAGETYSLKLSSVKAQGESSYASVKGKVKIPKAPGGIALKKTEYDTQDREVSIEFDTLVEWKAPKVQITRNGKNYVTKIDEKDRDEIEVKVKPLTIGEKYAVKISGIRKKGEDKYQTISFTFTS